MAELRTAPGMRERSPGVWELIVEAGRDLRQLARDIAAGDVSPSVLRRRKNRKRHSAVRDELPAEHPDDSRPDHSHDQEGAR